MHRVIFQNFKNQKQAKGAILAAAFLSSLLLSLMVTLFYNMWQYEIQQISLEEGDWQGRLTGPLTEEDLAVLSQYANVERAVLHTDSGDPEENVVALYFKEKSTAPSDLPKLAALLGLPPEAASLHHSLLALYLVRDPADTAPRLLFPLFLFLTALASASLILIIHHAFAVSMNARIHQLGILSSIGATPGQLRLLLMEEAALFCAAPMLLGNLLGIPGSMGILKAVNHMAAGISGRLDAVFTYHPLVFVLTMGITLLTMGISVWIPARKISKITPLNAIRNQTELSLKKKKSSRLLSVLFGMEGVLAGNALKAQKKALRTGSLALTISFLAFVLMECTFTLMGISQRMTYFERYQDAWDLMITVKHTEITDFAQTAEIQKLAGVESAVVYQKAAARRFLKDTDLSAALADLGGFQSAAPESAEPFRDGYLVSAPLIILDDESFLSYCAQIGAEQTLDGAIVYNCIRDFTDPNFRDRRLLPYLVGEAATAMLYGAEEEQPVPLPVAAYTDQTPVLREAYGDTDFFELTHFLPVSLWQKIKDSLEAEASDLQIRILAKENTDLEALQQLEARATGLLEPRYSIESENRLQAQMDNDKSIQGMMTIFGGFCILLASIGMASVFSNTMGFVQQRKREFARYLSMGLTPKGLKKIFFIEALILAGRPVLLTLPIAAAFVALMLRASYLDLSVFLAEAPVSPVLFFLLAVFLLVGLAYYLGGRSVLRSDLAEALRNDAFI